MKYKIGQKVKVIGNTNIHKFLMGEVVRIIDVKKDDYKAEYLDGRDWWIVKESDLEPLVKDFCTIDIGDVIVSPTLDSSIKGDEYRVIGRAGEMVFFETDTKSSFSYSEAELKKRGYTIKQNNPEEVVEMTVAEISKALGKNIKIVK